MKSLAKKVAFIAFVIFGINSASAQSVQLLGDFKDWSAFTTSQGVNKLCFVMSKPKDISPKPDGYDQAYFYISHRVNENIKNEINFVPGFKLAPNSDATIKIGSVSHKLFIKENSAWLDDASKSDELVGQMRAGATLLISALSSDGTKIVQTFSLSGATAASRAIDRACN